MGKIKIVGFDEDPRTLRGVPEGMIEGTVVQQPYEFGYQSVKLTGQVHRGRQVLDPGRTS